jgi:hypothetical protein
MFLMVTRRKAGRPPSGNGGKKVSDYPMIAYRLPKRSIALLQRTAAREKRPQWRVLMDAIEDRAKKSGVLR